MKKYLVSIALLTGVIYYAQDADPVIIKNAVTVYGNDFNVGTARSVAMANSMGALGGDLSSIDTNPAASGVFIKNNISFTLGILNYENENTFGNTYTTDNSIFNISNGGFALVLPLENASGFKSVTFAGNLQSQSIHNDLYFPSNSNVTFQLADDLTTQFNGFSDVREGSKTKFNLNLGTNYEDKIYLGASANIHLVELTQSQRYSDRNVLNGDTFYFNAWNTPYNETSNGFSLAVGVIGKVTQNIRVGASYNSPVWWNSIQQEYNFYDLDNLRTDVYFYDQDRINGAGNYTLSGAIVLENFALNVDYVKHLNQNTKFQPENDYQGENQFLDAYVQNSNELRIGAEYRINKLRLRGGWSKASSPFKDVYLTDGLRNANDVASNSAIKNLYKGERDLFSLGIGYNFGNFYMDFAYQNTNQEYNYLINGSFVDGNYNTFFFEKLDPANSYVHLSDANYTGSVKNSQNNYFLTLGWNF